MDTEALKSIIEGGAVGLAVALIILIYFILKWNFKIVGNHIDENTKVLTELSGYLRANTKDLDKIENKFNK